MILWILAGILLVLLVGLWWYVKRYEQQVIVEAQHEIQQLSEQLQRLNEEISEVEQAFEQQLQRVASRATTESNSN